MMHKQTEEALRLSYTTDRLYNDLIHTTHQDSIGGTHLPHTPSTPVDTLTAFSLVSEADMSTTPSYLRHSREEAGVETLTLII
jgi:hypothetical protein